jgi:hypothetical protein
MQRIVIILLAVIVVAGGGVAAWMYLGSDTSDKGFALLSDEQLAQYELTPTQDTRALTSTRSDGPTIKVSSPSGFSLNSPVDFDIQVEPRGGVKVDMGSLRIEYKLGPIWVNLTNRAMREAKVNGLRFSARGAELPSGRHALRLTVRDTDQRTTQAVVKFSVK